MFLLTVLVTMVVSSGNLTWSYFLLEVESSQFNINNIFSDVDDFRFLIGVDDSLERFPSPLLYF